MPDELATISIGGGGAIELRNMADCARLALFYQRAGMLPASHKLEAAAVAIQIGLGYGFQPIQALRCIAVINGRPTVHSEGVAAICRLGSEVSESVEWLLRGEPITAESVSIVLADVTQVDELTCRVAWKRGEQTAARTFGVRDARKAGLWGKVGPWQQYPARMMYHRARSWCARDLCADRLMGVDIGEVLPGGTVVNEIDTPPAVPLHEPKRIDSTVVDSKPVAQPAPLPPPHDCPGCGLPLPAGQTVCDLYNCPSRKAKKTISVAQRKLLFARAKERGVSDEALKAQVAVMLNIASSKDIPADRFDELLQWIEAEDQPPSAPPAVDLEPDVGF